MTSFHLSFISLKTDRGESGVAATRDKKAMRTDVPMSTWHLHGKMATFCRTSAFFICLLCLSLNIWLVSSAKKPILRAGSAIRQWEQSDDALVLPDKEAVLWSSIEPFLSIRGGQIKKGKGTKRKIPKVGQKKKGGVVNAVKEALNNILPATRAYLWLCVFCTIVHVAGLPAPVLFSLDAGKILQLWRPFTSVSYLGAPSMSMANNIYFLVRYGQQLERSNGTGVHAWFLLVQTVILSLLGLLLKFPFQANAMISAALYNSCAMAPNERIPFQFGLIITSWQLPYCMIAIDCLSQQSAAAAWPHVLGILSGHTYHFFTQTWPRLGGRAVLEAPKWFVRRFGGRANSNIKGIDFAAAKEKASSNKHKAGRKSRPKKGGGNKLGGSRKK